MSVIATPVKQTDAVRSADAVYLVDIATGLPGSLALSGPSGGPATQINPIPVTEAQGIIASGPVTIAAGVAQTVAGAFADRRGARILNYTASPVYVTNGTTGTPPSGGGSDYIPASVAGVPGQWSPPYAPVNGLRVVGAAAGDLTVTLW